MVVPLKPQGAGHLLIRCDHHSFPSQTLRQFLPGDPAGLAADAQRALLYLYRTSTLFQELQREEVRAFLRQWGYQRFSPEEALAHLRERVAAAGAFPHEIGVFLGYPLSDVQEFIRSAGRNCLLSGYWKVYSNADAAREIFARYRKCTDVYLRRFQDGFSLSRLTVCAKKAA